MIRDAAGNITHCTCYACYGTLPVAYFGASIAGPGGYNNRCTACHNQDVALNRAKQFNWKTKHDDLIRIVKRHNTLILNESITNDIELIGYGVKTKCLYRIVFSKGQYLDRLVLIYKGDSVDMAFEVMANDSAVDRILKLLKHDFIRLERSEVDLLESKAVIYAVSL